MGGSARISKTPGSLIGRDDDLEYITAYVDRAAVSGGAFQRLGAEPWAARAGSELRATGLTIGNRAENGPASLTPQQLQIATLAAAGLTNKQIGERLYLSPRTVAAHLHQVFPKLGVTTRAALRDALAGHQMSQPAAVAALITQAMAATRG